MKLRWYRALTVACLPIVLAGCASTGGTGGSYWNSGDFWKCAGSGAAVGAAAGSTNNSQTAGWGALGGAVVGAVVCGLTHHEKAPVVTPPQTTEEPKQPEQPEQPEQNVTKTVINEVDGLIFTLNSASLQPRSEEQLNKLIPELIESDATVVISGYTDTTGQAEYNKHLSQQRAETVARYLQEHGVNAANITAVGYGEANPVADNSTLAGRKKNRRVALKITSNT